MELTRPGETLFHTTASLETMRPSQVPQAKSGFARYPAFVAILLPFKLGILGKINQKFKLM